MMRCAELLGQSRAEPFFCSGRVGIRPSEPQQATRASRPQRNQSRGGGASDSPLFVVVRSTKIEAAVAIANAAIRFMTAKREVSWSVPSLCRP
jgi:hypothetical protein